MSKIALFNLIVASEAMFLMFTLSMLRLTEGIGEVSLPSKIASADRVPELNWFSFKIDNCPAAATSAFISNLSAVRCRSASALSDIVP